MSHEQVEVRVDQPLAIPDSRCHLGELGSNLEELGNGVGRQIAAPGRPAHTRARWGCRPAVRARGPPAQSRAPFPRKIVAKCPRQTGEQPRAELDVVVAERGDTFFEKWHQLAIRSCPRPDDDPAVARSCTRELARQAEATGDGGGLEEDLSCYRTVSGPRLCIGQREQQLAPHLLFSWRRKLERI